MNLGSFIHFSIFLIFSHFEWLVFGVSSGLLYVVWWLFGLGFNIKINLWNDWQVFPAYSISDFVNLQSVVYLWSWHLLPLTQNSLPSEDVQEYFLLMLFDAVKVQGPPGDDFKWIWDYSFIFQFFSFFLILSGWCSGSPVGCFKWFGAWSASVLISRFMFKVIGR